MGSVLLLALVLFGWSRSYTEVQDEGYVKWLWTRSGFDGDRSYSNSFLASDRGELFFEHERLDYATQPTTVPTNLYQAEDDVGVRTPALRGFGWVAPIGFSFSNEIADGPRGKGSLLQATVPYWSLAAVCMILPLFWLVRRFRSKRRATRGLA
jgi:hypothetical protein